MISKFPVLRPGSAGACHYVAESHALSPRETPHGKGGVKGAADDGSGFWRSGMGLVVKRSAGRIPMRRHLASDDRRNGQ